MTAGRTYLLLLLALAVPFGLFLLWSGLELEPQLVRKEILQLERTAHLI